MAGSHPPMNLSSILAHKTHIAQSNFSPVLRDSRLFKQKQVQSTLFISTFNTKQNVKIDNLTGTKSLLKRWQFTKNMQEHCIQVIEEILTNIQNIILFYEEIRIKEGLSCI